MNDGSVSSTVSTNLWRAPRDEAMAPASSSSCGGCVGERAVTARTLSPSTERAAVRSSELSTPPEKAMATPDDDVRRRYPEMPDRVVIKTFALAEGSALPQILRESRALESAKQLGLVFEHGGFEVVCDPAGMMLDRVVQRFPSPVRPPETAIGMGQVAIGVFEVRVEPHGDGAGGDRQRRIQG